MTILVTSLGMLLVVAASLFIVWPLLGGAIAAASAPEASAREVSTAHAEAVREAALAAIREAEFDHRVGKLSDEDHAALRLQLENEALRAIEALDVLRAASPGAKAGDDAAGPESPLLTRNTAEAPAPSTTASYCPGCGQPAAGGARYCATCGAPAPKAGRRSRGPR